MHRATTPGRMFEGNLIDLIGLERYKLKRAMMSTVQKLQLYMLKRDRGSINVVLSFRFNHRYWIEYVLSTVWHR